MIRILQEDPLPILLTGVALAALCGAWLLQTGRRAALGCMLAAIAATGLLLFVEHKIVTEHERVENMLYALADVLPENDTQATLDYISPTVPGLRGDVGAVLERVYVRMAKIGGNLRITINELTVPPSATATFTGRVDVEFRSGAAGVQQTGLRKFTLDLTRENDRWYVAGYHHESPVKVRAGEAGDNDNKF